MKQPLLLALTTQRRTARGLTAAHRPRTIVVGLWLALILLALRLPAVAQAPAWQSARAVAVATAAVPFNFSEVTATAVDATGNVFLAGSFMNTVALGNTTLVSSGSYDAFVAKFDPVNNQFLWAQRMGGSTDDFANAIVVSSTGVYVAGNFTSATADCGPIRLSNSDPSGTSDVFVAKLTDAGITSNFTWAQRAGGTGDDGGNALAVNGNNVYLAGGFSSPSASFGSTTLVNAGPFGYGDAFVTKLTDAGTTGGFVWALQAGGTNSGFGSGDFATALAVSGPNVYMAGSFDGSTAYFGSIALANAGLSGNRDVFVTKLADTGSTGGFIWAQRAGGTRDDFAAAVAVSGPDVYMAGEFESTSASFGATTLNNAGINGSADVFVTKLTDAGTTGNFTWAQRAGGTLADFAMALAVSGTSVYVGGSFNSSTANFGPTILTNAGGSADLFVTKLTDAGSTSSFTWAQRAGGRNDDFAYALSISRRTLYVAGSFYSPIAGFGSLTISNANTDTVGFLASLTDPTLTATTPGHVLAPAQLYPNPAHHTATLRLSAGTAPAPLTLTDAQGRTVRRYPAPAGLGTVLDLRGLPAGLYLLRGAGPAQRLAVE